MDITSDQTASTSIDNANNNDTINTIELENLFLLRMPSLKDGSLHPATKKLREVLATGENLSQRLFIDLNADTRKGSIKFDDEIFKGRLVDLPCIIESLKTHDKKTLFKTNDISQMFVCKANDDDDGGGKSSESDEENKNKNNDNQQKHAAAAAVKNLWMHGITPPLKNVRKKRFRRVAKKKIIDYAEIEKEVKSLFRADRDAIKVEYEILYVDEPATHTDDDDNNKTEDLNKKLFKKSKKKQHYDALLLGDESMNNLESVSSPGGTHVDSSNDGMMIKSRNKYNFFMEEVIGDLSSTDSDVSESDRMLIQKKKSSDKNNSFMDIGDESTNLYAPNIDTNTNISGPQSNLQNDYDDSITNIFDDTSNMDQHNRGDDNENFSLSESSNQSSPHSSMSSLLGKNNNEQLNRHLEKLLDDLEQIQVQRKRQEDEINQISNPVLKSRLLARLHEILDEEKRKSNEIDSLKSSMS